MKATRRSSHRDVRRLLAPCLWVGLLLSLRLAPAQAQISLDGSLGPRTTLVGPDYVIPPEVGQIRGSNLFHSFGQFHVLAGESATFTGPQAIHNVIGRVTGGSASFIDGLLRSAVPGANLYLLNPSGVMFGPNASLDVSGSFHVSTADFLRFADDAVFSANLGAESVLTVAPPAAFGFLSQNPARISIQESLLQVPEANTLSVVGGDIEITGGSLHAPSGQIHLASIASAGEGIPHPSDQPPGFTVDTVERLGNVTLSKMARVDTSGDGGGTVVIRGGRLVLDQSSILADTLGNADGAETGIDIETPGDIRHSRGGFITAASGGSGNAGDIKITARHLGVEGALIGAGSFMNGQAGDVVIDVDTLTLTEGAIIDSSTSATGAGGNLTVTAADTLAISGQDRVGNPSGLFANTFGSSDAGDVTVSASTLRMQGGKIQAAAAGTSRGDAGEITVKVGQLTLTEGAQIDSSSFGSGQGGRLVVKATEAVSITDRHAEGFSSGLFSNAQGSGTVQSDSHPERLVSVSTPILEMQGGRIQASTDGAGRAGNIELKAGRLLLADGAQIASTTFATGQGGDVTITAPEIRIAGENTRLDAETRGAGPAGSIQMEVDRLVLTEAAQISTSTRGPGPGGTLAVTAHESIEIVDHEGGPFRSGLFSNSGEGEAVAGDAGNIMLTAPRLRVDGGRILTRTLGDANAGNIMLQVERLELLGGAQIFNGIGNAQASGEILGNPDGEGRGGQLRVNATASMVIAGRDRVGFRSGLFSSTQIGRGRAGDIVVTTPHLEMRDGGRIGIESGQASLGDAGNLTVEAETVTLREEAQIDSSTFGPGQGGTVTIRGRGNATMPAKAVTISGPGSGLLTTAAGSGQGGDIRLEAQTLRLTGEAIISVESSGIGNAGNIRLTADTFLSENSTVTTEAAQADGGNIELSAQHMVRLRDSEITATVGGGAGTTGGNITIDPEFVVLQNSHITANAFQGRGGNITIEANVFLADPISAVTAIALDPKIGIDGAIDIRAPIADLSGSVGPLPQNFEQAAVLLRQRCAERLRGGQISSLIVAGRDGVPAEPEGGLPSLLIEPNPDMIQPNQSFHQPPAATHGSIRVDHHGTTHLHGGSLQAFFQMALPHDCAGLRLFPPSPHPTR